MKTRKYVCAECGKAVTMNGAGLKTAHCPSHPSRNVTVPRDLSGGKEVDRNNRKASIVVTRPTQVKVIYENRDK